jgi:hypothetical protein
MRVHAAPVTAGTVPDAPVVAEPVTFWNPAPVCPDPVKEPDPTVRVLLVPSLPEIVDPDPASKFQAAIGVPGISSP